MKRITVLIIIVCCLGCVDRRWNRIMADDAEKVIYSHLYDKGEK